MPDQQEQERLQEQQRQEREHFQQWQQQGEQLGYLQPGTLTGGQATMQQPRTQQQYDTIFGEQMFGDAATREVHQQYWQNAEETIRLARRVSEVYTMSLMRQHLVQTVSQAVIPQITQFIAQDQTIARQVALQVVSQLQQNPQLLRQAVQQAQQATR